jgi:hypothetical protein
MNRKQPQEDQPPKPVEPLREYGHAPVLLFVYLSFLVILNFLLIGQEKKPVISC